MTSTGEEGYRGARFEGADFSGATFRDCDLRGVKVADAWLIDVRLSGYVERLVVNDVDVTDFVDAELDRQHPERVQLRQVQTTDDYRAMWDTIERVWSALIDLEQVAPCRRHRPEASSGRRPDMSDSRQR